MELVVVEDIAVVEGASLTKTKRMTFCYGIGEE